MGVERFHERFKSNLPNRRASRPRVWAGFGAGIAALLVLLTAAGCGAGGKAEPGGVARAAAPEGDATLVIGAYSVVKDAMAELLPAFQAEWKARTGQNVRFQESYEASGTQARAIASGFAADVAVLAMEGDMDKIVAAGLMSPDWKNAPYGGMITRSIVVLGVRPGNPKGIRDFDDLTSPGVKVLYPNPKTSGGAQWVINAIYGAGLLKAEAETGRKDPASAKAFLAAVHRNIESMDKSGRASMAAFEYGVGDVIVTYENELLARIMQGAPHEIVTPSRTILIENPAAVVTRNAEAHGVRELAEAFVAYLRSEEAQRIFVRHGFRPVDPAAAGGLEGKFADPDVLFTIRDLGGWDEVRETLYSPRGVWYEVLAGK